MSISLHPDTPESHALAGSPAMAAAPASSGRKIRSRLFTKYVALFVAVVAVALLSNGIFEVFFYYREHKASLIRIQHEQAEAAAAKIGQFIKEIESQLGWTTLLPWSADSVEQRRFDALRLLRQVPAITELAQVDATGKERLRVSRLAMDGVDTGANLSGDPKFTEAMARKVWYGPVYFRRESEPYMTLSLAGPRKDAGVSIAEVNLKLIWDVVSQIKVGEHGHAYVVGPEGRLIAHPDISLVLRNTDMSQLSQVKAARTDNRNAAAELQGAKNIQGQEVLTASAPIAPLGWTMFVELPVEEAYASLYQALQRLAVVLLAASIFAVLAGVFLARRMVGPIQALRAGAERIGGGDFAQRISIHTGDELEGLANQFNDMGARLQESYADLEKKVEVRTAELSETLQRQTATADILKVIASSPSNVQPVFDAIATSANRLVGGFSTAVFRFVDDTAHLAAFTPTNPAADEVLKSRFPRPIAGYASFQLVRGGEAVQIVDTESSPELRDIAQARGYRSMLFTPLVSSGAVIGLVSVTRKQPGTFAPHHVQLLRTFADQAVIAIENVRLFDQVQARTAELQESLEYQTATADVLNVISRSTTNVQPVFDAIATSAARLFEPCETTIITVHDGLLHWQATASLGRPVEAIERVKRLYPMPFDLVNSPSSRAIDERRIIEIPDATAPDTPDSTRRAQSAGGFRSITFVPLLRDGVGIGTIILTHPQAGFRLSPKQLALVQTFADQAVIAIENARLFDEVQAKTAELTETLEYQTATADVLNVISRSPNNLQPVMDTIVHTARRLCQSEYAMMLQCGDDGIFRLAAHSNVGEEFIDWMQKNPVMAGDGSAVGIVAAEKKTIHLPDALADPRFTDLRRQRQSKARTMLAVPLLRDEAVIGIVFLARTDVKPFSDKQVELVTSFADQAVIAINNVSLFDEVQERTRELTQSLDELRTAQDRLVQTEKLASLGQLTAGIAHEIKNPLNFVNNFSALSAELVDELNEVLGPAALDGKVREEIDELTHMLKGNLEKVVQHGKRADSIVKNMLLHSREGAGEHRPADINAIVEESLNLAYHGARAEKSGFNITLQRDLDPAAGMIDLYPQEITRVFLNLISNGFYAATKRKEAAADGFEPTLSASTRSFGNTVEIRIRDNGTGIPLEVKEKMFNPFFTTKPAGEGTGLGLSMSHDIVVKQHGGKIDVETEPGAFTEFIITLPRSGAANIKAGGTN
jgi:two-component system NtrC family sensor kinase